MGRGEAFLDPRGNLFFIVVMDKVGNAQADPCRLRIAQDFRNAGAVLADDAFLIENGAHVPAIRHECLVETGPRPALLSARRYGKIPPRHAIAPFRAMPE